MHTRWHWPPDSSWGRRSATTAGSRPTASRISSMTGLPATCWPPDLRPLGHDVADPATRVERRHRVLEDHLHLRPGPPQLPAGQAGQLGAGEPHRTRRRLGQLHDGPTGGGLAAARLADQAEGLAFEHVERHPRHGVDPAAARGRELHDQVVHGQDGPLVGAQVGGAGPATSAPDLRSERRAGARRTRPGHRPRRHGRRPGRSRRSGGPPPTAGRTGSPRRSGRALGDAAGLGQPAAGGEAAARRRLHQVGRAARDGGQPGVAGSSTLGMDASSASV